MNTAAVMVVPGGLAGAAIFMAVMIGIVVFKAVQKSRKADLSARIERQEWAEEIEELESMELTQAPPPSTDPVADLLATPKPASRPLPPMLNSETPEQFNKRTGRKT